MFVVAVHDPVSGSYSSAFTVGNSPPATSTLPSGSSVAVWLKRGVTIFPVADQVPLSGSYSLGADDRHEHLAVGQQRGRRVGPYLGAQLPVAVHVPLAGSYTSAPLGVRVAVGDVAHEHLAVAQQRGREAAVGIEHVPGRRPGPAGRVVQLGGGQVGLTV